MKSADYKRPALIHMLSTACTNAVVNQQDTVAVSPALWEFVVSLQPNGTDGKKIGFMSVRIIRAAHLPEYSCIPCLSFDTFPTAAE